MILDNWTDVSRNVMETYPTDITLLTLFQVMTIDVILRLQNLLSFVILLLQNFLCMLGVK